MLRILIYICFLITFPIQLLLFRLMFATSLIDSLAYMSRHVCTPTWVCPKKKNKQTAFLRHTHDCQFFGYPVIKKIMVGYLYTYHFCLFGPMITHHDFYDTGISHLNPTYPSSVGEGDHITVYFGKSIPSHGTVSGGGSHAQDIQDQDLDLTAATIKTNIVGWSFQTFLMFINTVWLPECWWWSPGWNNPTKKTALGPKNSIWSSLRTSVN